MVELSAQQIVDGYTLIDSTTAPSFQEMIEKALRADLSHQLMYLLEDGTPYAITLGKIERRYDMSLQSYIYSLRANADLLSRHTPLNATPVTAFVDGHTAPLAAPDDPYNPLQQLYDITSTPRMPKKKLVADRYTTAPDPITMIRGDLSQRDALRCVNCRGTAGNDCPLCNGRGYYE